MVSHMFLLIIFLSILLHYLHGLECVKTKFWQTEPNIYFFTKKFKAIPESVYYVFHGSLWIFLLLSFFLLLGGKWLAIPLALYGTTFITEFHHFIKGVRKRSYYPGMITSFFFPVIGIFYWTQLIQFLH